MSKRNLVCILDCNSEDKYKKRLEEIGHLVKDENNIRIVLADTNFYLSKIFIIDEVFGKTNKLEIIDLQSKRKVMHQIDEYMQKRGYSVYDTI